MPPTSDDSYARLTPRYFVGRRTQSLVIELETRCLVRRPNGQSHRYTYVVDTGADYVMMPLKIARVAAIEGFNHVAPLAPLPNTLQTRFLGSFGTIKVRIGQDFSDPLHCYYYQLDPRNLTPEKWARAESKPLPIILGRPILDRFNLGVQNGGFVITRRPILDPSFLPFP